MAGLVGVVLAVLCWAQPAGAQGATTTTLVTETVITVEGGPARNATFHQPCNDVVLVLTDERVSFVLGRSGPTTAPLTVTYALSGSAESGVHYDPLPGSVTFPAGSASTTVTVVPRQTPRGALVELTLQVTGGTPVAPPPTWKATIRFVSPPEPGPHECGYRFTADPWNASQTIAVGATPRGLSLEQFAPPALIPATGNFRVVDGSLPPGIQLLEDGSFGGAATTTGTFTARIEACRPQPPGTCVTTALTVTVTGGPREPLARTGPLGTIIAQVVAAALLVVSGVLGLSAVPPRSP